MLIHCTMNELLAIRDGEGSQAALRHLDECDACCHEFELLHQRAAALKALPALRSPRDRWSVVRDEVVASRTRKRRRFAGWLTVAVAASVLFTLGFGQLIIPAAREPDPLVELVQQAQEIEQVIRTFRPDRRVISGRTAGAVAALEDRISLLDARFAVARQRQASRERLILLLQERVELMDALLNVRRSPVTYRGF